MRNTTRASNRPGRSVVATALATALGISLLGMAPPTLAQQAATHQFAVASQPLGEALNRLAETAGVQIMVPPELVRGHTAPALAGQYTVGQALDKLLAGTGLVHRSTRGGVITLARAPAAAPEPRPSSPATTTGAAEARDMAAVQVTGSRIKRAEVEGPSPVMVISAQQIENEGHATVFEALETLVMAGGAVEKIGRAHV